MRWQVYWIKHNLWIVLFKIQHSYYSMCMFVCACLCVSIVCVCLQDVHIATTHTKVLMKIKMWKLWHLWCVLVYVWMIIYTYFVINILTVRCEVTIIIKSFQLNFISSANLEYINHDIDDKFPILQYCLFSSITYLLIYHSFTTIL